MDIGWFFGGHLGAGESETGGSADSDQLPENKDETRILALWKIPAGKYAKVRIGPQMYPFRDIFL